MKLLIVTNFEFQSKVAAVTLFHLTKTAHLFVPFSVGRRQKTFSLNVAFVQGPVWTVPCHSCSACSHSLPLSGMNQPWVTGFYLKRGILWRFIYACPAENRQLDHLSISDYTRLIVEVLTSTFELKHLSFCDITVHASYVRYFIVLLLFIHSHFVSFSNHTIQPFPLSFRTSLRPPCVFHHVEILINSRLSFHLCRSLCISLDLSRPLAAPSQLCAVRTQAAYGKICRERGVKRRVVLAAI